MICALYTSILGLLWLFLTFYVILGRWKYRVSLGDGGEKEMNRRIRSHGNFVETVPLALILLWIGESNVFDTLIVHCFGMMLVLGRCLHAYGMLFHKRTVNLFRQIGMSLTMSVIGGSSVWILVSILLIQ